MNIILIATGFLMYYAGPRIQCKRMKNAGIKGNNIFKSFFYYNIALLNFIKTQVMLPAISQRQHYLFKFDSMSFK